MKRVAVLTDALSASFFFPSWCRYYGALFGAENLHVITYAGLKTQFASAAIGNLWVLNSQYDDRLRAAAISDFVKLLLNSYDVILRCDVDEFLVPDLRKHRDLAAYVQHTKLPYVTARGIDMVELPDDAPLDFDAPIIGIQRAYGVRATALNKTCLTTRPLRWAAGFHGADVPPKFDDLYLFHFKFAALTSRISWHERMLEGLAEGSSEQRYFGVGPTHLNEYQAHLAAKPRAGDESEAAFDARFLASVGSNPRDGIHQGAFFTQDFLHRIDPIFAGADALPNRMRGAEALKPFAAALHPQNLGERMVAMLEPAASPMHGTWLTRRLEVLLFGRHHLVDANGAWSSMFGADDAPATPPDITKPAERLDLPVFLANPPPAGARWLAAMPAILADYQRFGTGRRLLCAVSFPWQREFLAAMGLGLEDVVIHDPGALYLCADVMVREHDLAPETVSQAERMQIFECVARTRRHAGARRIYLSSPNIPPEINGFETMLPDRLAVDERIGRLAGAEQIISAGGDTLFNVAFCGPDARVLCLSVPAAAADARLLGSLGLDYAIAPDDLRGEALRGEIARFFQDG